MLGKIIIINSLLRKNVMRCALFLFFRNKKFKHWQVIQIWYKRQQEMVIKTNQHELKEN